MSSASLLTYIQIAARDQSHAPTGPAAHLLLFGLAIPILEHFLDLCWRNFLLDRDPEVHSGPHQAGRGPPCGQGEARESGTRVVWGDVGSFLYQEYSALYKLQRTTHDSDANEGIGVNWYQHAGPLVNTVGAAPPSTLPLVSAPT